MLIFGSRKVLKQFVSGKIFGSGKTFWSRKKFGSGNFFGSPKKFVTFKKLGTFGSSKKNLGSEQNLAISNICDGWGGVGGCYTLLIIMPLLRPNPFGFFPQGRVWKHLDSNFFNLSIISIYNLIML